MTPVLAGVLRPVSPRLMNEAFYRAVVAADRAPSAHDRRPWRWHVGTGGLELFADRARMSGLPDPGGGFTMISCGATLHHARVTLAARGWRVTVARLPDAGEPGLLARLHIDGHAPVNPATADLARCIRLRHTDIRPVTGGPLEPPVLRTIGTAFASQHVRFTVLRPDQILGLTMASAHVQEPSSAEVQWHAELALWSGAGRIAGDTGNLRLPIAHGDHDRAASFAVLHGPGDQDIDWLHAGEALSTGSLVATGLGVSVLPLSAPIEHVGAQQRLRRVMPEIGVPYQLVRLGRYQAAGGDRSHDPSASWRRPRARSATGAHDE
jgi:nitroreductase